MANIDRVRVELTGFPGGPGVATHYALNATVAVPSLRALWAELVKSMPGNVAVKVVSAGDTINDTTGALVGSWSVADAAGFQGTGTTRYAAPTGLLIAWLTDTILDGHRIKGRTFLVPIVSEAFDLDGSVINSTVTGIALLGTNYINAQAGNAVIWHRPRAAKPANGTIPAVTARVGGHAIITACRVPDKAVVLRSRRD